MTIYKDGPDDYRVCLLTINDETVSFSMTRSQIMRLHSETTPYHIAKADRIARGNDEFLREVFEAENPKGTATGWKPTDEPEEAREPTLADVTAQLAHIIERLGILEEMKHTHVGLLFRRAPLSNVRSALGRLNELSDDFE